MLELGGYIFIFQVCSMHIWSRYLLIDLVFRYHDDGNVKYFLQVLDGLLSEYEVSFHGPGKWQKVATFLHQRFVPLSLCGLFFHYQFFFFFLLDCFKDISVCTIDDSHGGTV